MDERHRSRVGLSSVSVRRTYATKRLGLRRRPEGRGLRGRTRPRCAREESGCAGGGSTSCRSPSAQIVKRLTCAEGVFQAARGRAPSGRRDTPAVPSKQISRGIDSYTRTAPDHYPSSSRLAIRPTEWVSHAATRLSSARPLPRTCPGRARHAGPTLRTLRAELALSWPLREAAAVPGQRLLSFR
jgi:hypothetical protein